VLHGWVKFGVQVHPSSTVPLQLLSSPSLQTSAAAACWLALHAPQLLPSAAQVDVPAAQMPFRPVLQDLVVEAGHTHPLSTVPSQSLSSPSPQISAEGWLFWPQVPHESPFAAQM
jgi:hypothetical protein